MCSSCNDGYEMDATAERCFLKCKDRQDSSTERSWKSDFERGTNALTGKPGNRNIFVIPDLSSTDGFLSLKEDSTEMWSTEANVYSCVSEVVQQQLREDGINFAPEAGVNLYGVDVGFKLMYSETESTRTARGALASKEKGYFREKKFTSKMTVTTDANRAVLTDQFEKAVIDLSTDPSDFSAWRQLYRNYGTHYHLKSYIGAQVEVYSEWEKEETQDWSSRETIACAEVSGEIQLGIPIYPGITVTGGGSMGYSTCESAGSKRSFNT